MRRVGVVAGVIALILVGGAMGVPALGTALTVSDPPARADVALVLEGTGADAISVVETWRQQGLVHEIVIVEAPVKTHALVAYWSDFVRWGLAAPSPTPAEYLRIVRAPNTQAGAQAEAALPSLAADGAHSMLVAGGGGIGSRVVEGQLQQVLGPEGISLRMVPYGTHGRDPADWIHNGDDRRAVLDSWLQLLVPYLSGY